MVPDTNLVMTNAIPAKPKNKAAPRRAPNDRAPDKRPGPTFRLVPDGKRAATKQQNRQMILDAARDVFSTLGYGGATVRDIIRRTGLASGTFYNYFRSKEEIYEAIIDENALRVRPRLRAERIRAKTIEDFVRGGFDTFFDYIATDRMAFQIVREQAQNPKLRRTTPEILAGFDELRTDIDIAIAAGVLPKVDSAYLMSAIAGIAFEVGDRMLERDPLDPKGAAHFATTMILGGLAMMKDGQK